jgi:hypothetical protein
MDGFIRKYEGVLEGFLEKIGQGRRDWKGKA